MDCSAHVPRSLATLPSSFKWYERIWKIMKCYERMLEKTCGKMATRQIPCGPQPCFCHQMTSVEPSLECSFQPASEGHGNSKGIVQTKHRQSRPFVLSAGGQPVRQQHNHLPVHFDTTVHYRERFNVGLEGLCVTLRQAPSLGVSDSGATGATCHAGHSK